MGKILENGYCLDTMVYSNDGLINEEYSNNADGILEESEFELWFDEDLNEEVIVNKFTMEILKKE
ncbi:MAG: hypothetical protein GY853_00635 [PVC group bacterium]|nr:hypothetical protein [PVC group bacterium]